MNIAGIIFLFLFGTIVGSFLNVVIWRLPRGENLLGRSRCPGCRKTLSVLDLFPVLSFIFLQGKCRYCGKRISFRYPLIEIITGLLFALVWLFLNPAAPPDYLLLIKSLIVAAVLVVVFVVDLEHFLILDNVIFPAGVVIFLLNFIIDLVNKSGLFYLHSHFLGGVIGAAAAATPFFLVWYFSKGRWMGFGDVKLALFLGLALGWPLVYVNLLAAVFLGGIIAAFLLASRKKNLKSQVPFGTFLSIGALLALLWGERLLHWYLSLLGY